MAISDDLGVAPIAEEIRRVFRDRIGRFRHLFREARESDPPLQKATPIFETLRAAGFVAAFKDLLAHKRELLGLIADFRRGITSLETPLTLIRHYARSLRVDYIARQTYLTPHPKQLMLRSVIV